MLILGVLVAFLRTSSAIDLTGCSPNEPQVIDGVRQLTGYVYSPGYREGQNYPDNIACQFNIRAPTGFTIKLEFVDVDIEAADRCTRDAVVLTDLSEGPPLTLGVFCGNQTFPPILSQGNMVEIQFLSDYMIARKGFRIRYTVSEMLSLCSFGQGVCKNRNCFSLANRCNGKDECGDGTDEENCGLPPPVTKCGLRNASGLYGHDRVVGGKEAEPGSWPWQADLQVSFIHPNGHICGGTLISAQWVLSAAHCFGTFRHPEAWRIHLGNHNKFKTDDTEQVRMVERIILYPGTTGEELLVLPDIDLINDIALLKLNTPVKLTDSVRPACLPTQGYELPQGTKCMASGWGMTRGTGMTHALKEVEFTIQDAAVCNTLTGPINKDTMICVRNSKGFQDVCHGDSGGPLSCKLNGTWHVMGATSFGALHNYQGGLCALPGSATVYAKSSHKTDWIREQISQYS